MIKSSKIFFSHFKLQMIYMIMDNNEKQAPLKIQRMNHLSKNQIVFWNHQLPAKIFQLNWNAS